MDKSGQSNGKVQANGEAASVPPRRADGVVNLPFPAYRGSEPYIFISYSHADSAQVYPIIADFNRAGYKVWYDEGIEPGIEWPEEIANALDHCALFVVFISPTAVGSPNVRNEVNFALTNGTPFIAIHLTLTTLTPGLRLQIGSKQAILKYNLDEQSFRRKYTYSFESVLPTMGGRVPASGEAATALTVQSANGGPVGGRSDSSARPESTWREVGAKAGAAEDAGPTEHDFQIEHGVLQKFSGKAAHVTIPESVIMIAKYAFADCERLESVEITKNVWKVAEECFMNCSHLTSVTVPKSVKNLSPVAFINCPQLVVTCFRSSVAGGIKCYGGMRVVYLDEESSDS